MARIKNAQNESVNANNGKSMNAQDAIARIMSWKADGKCVVKELPKWTYVCKDEVSISALRSACLAIAGSGDGLWNKTHLRYDIPAAAWKEAKAAWVKAGSPIDEVKDEVVETPVREKPRRTATAKPLATGDADVDAMDRIIATAGDVTAFDFAVMATFKKDADDELQDELAQFGFVTTGGGHYATANVARWNEVKARYDVAKHRSQMPFEERLMTLMNERFKVQDAMIGKALQIGEQNAKHIADLTALMTQVMTNGLPKKRRTGAGSNAMENAAQQTEQKPRRRAAGSVLNNGGK